MIVSQRRQQFINNALKLDALASFNGTIAKCVINIAETSNEDAVIELCKILKSVSETGDKLSRRFALTLKDDLIYLLGYERVNEICGGRNTKSNEPEMSLDELMAELNGLVGLSNVKSKVNDLIAFQKVQQLRKQNGLPVSKNTMHLAFTGNPGTGKTTVARIFGRIYKKLGILSSGHFIEVSRTDLIAGYQGQTALKVKKIIEKAKGGVLFIDEAYSITENEHTDSYGRECLTELTKALEDYRDDLVVIVAGYTEPMNVFFESNPGLRSRFNNFIEFDDYSSLELYEILIRMCTKSQYELDQEAKLLAKNIFEDAVCNKGAQFSNGRFARNLFEGLIMNHSRRVARIARPTIKDLYTIMKDDFVNKYGSPNHMKPSSYG